MDPAQPRYRACKQCVRDKQRCEDVRSDGCERCRKKRRDCSILDDLRADDHNTAVTQGSSSKRRRTGDAVASFTTREEASLSLEAVQRRLEMVEAAYTELLQLHKNPSTIPTSQITPISSLAGPSAASIPHLTPATTSLGRPPRHQPDNHAENAIYIAPRPLDVRAFAKVMASKPSSLVFSESSMSSLVNQDGFPDIVKRGHISQYQMEMYFQMFKHRFSTYYPLIPFLTTISPLPTHPFVLLATLAFLPDALPSTANGMIDESILYTMTGCGSKEVVLALYILSLAPFQSGSGRHVPLTSLRVISLAHSIGKNLGWNKLAEVSLGPDRKAELLESEASERLELLVLWEAVKNRLGMLSIQWVRCSALPELLATQLPDHPSEHVQRCVSRLRWEQSLVETCLPLINLLSLAEIDAIRNWPETDLLVCEWETVRDKVDAIVDGVKDENPLLFAEASFLTGSLAVRISLLIHQPPCCIHPDILDTALQITAWNFISCGTKLIFEVIPKLVKISVPANIAILICGYLAAGRRAIILTRPTPIIDEVKLAAAESWMASQAGLPGKALREMWASLYEENQLPQSLEPAGSKAEGGDGQMDWSAFFNENFDFDFPTLDMLLAGATQTSGEGM